MPLQDQIALFALVFFPLIATIFITLTPNVDIEAQTTLAKFFALMECLVLAYIFFLFFKKNVLATTAISFPFLNLNINFDLKISDKNIFLYCISIIVLTFNSFLSKHNNYKNNIQQASPFLFTFILHIILGQSDIKIALPILSLSSFIIFFMMALSNQPTRGSTIFRMGIFLICCDSICLIIIQTKNMFLSLQNPILTFILLLAPGLARMSLPMFFPSMKQFYTNCQEDEAPIIIAFLQISGFFLITLIQKQLNFSLGLSIIIIVMSLIGAMYISALSLSEKQNNLNYYYNLIFYSSLSVCVLFAQNTELFLKLSTSLFICNIYCYITSFYINKKNLNSFNFNEKIKNKNFTSLLFLGIPGIGIGCSLWIIIWNMLNQQKNLIINICFLFWLILYFLFVYTVIIESINIKQLPNNNQTIYEKKFLFNSNINKFLFFLGLFVNIAIPFLTLYAP